MPSSFGQKSGRIYGAKREYPKSLAATEDILPLPEWCSGLEDS